MEILPQQQDDRRKPKKILIVTYYGLREALFLGAIALKKCGYEVDSYSLMKYSSDINEKRLDYIDHFDRHIQASNPDVVLFWCLSISTLGLKELKKRHAHRVFALFCWDDPGVWYVSDNEMNQKASAFDIVFPTCKESCSWYVVNGAKKAVFLAPGFDPSVHYPKKNINYQSQVSFCITNLYENIGEQIITRKKLIDDIIADGTIQFKLYGPANLKSRYPNHYSGWVDYENIHNVFANSLINICTHFIGSRCGYINERSVLIAASGGCLLVDPVPGIEELLEPNKHCVIMDVENPVEQIKTLLKDEERLKQIGEEARIWALQKYTYDHWAGKIHEELSQFLL